MAHIHPTLPHPADVAGLSGPDRMGTSLGTLLELELLQTLQSSLPDAYTLFHSVDWAHAMSHGTAHGEIDIAVLNQAGDLLLIEVKGGQVNLTPEGIFKTYSHGYQRNVSQQVNLQYGAIRQRLQDLGAQVRVHQLLVLPHMRVLEETARWPRERIVDSEQYDDLPHRIQSLLGPGVWNEAQHQQLYRFLANIFAVQVDVSTMLNQVQRTTSLLSSGLAMWVPRIQAPQGIYRIQGTAGSGKTQLALQLLNDAAQLGQRCAYFCYNTSLARLISQRVHATVQVQTFHHYARTVYEAQGHTVDFQQPDIFERMGQAAADHLARDDVAPDLDLLVIDETQDLNPAWAQTLLHRIKPTARAYLLEDREQSLYPDRDAFDAQGEVTITCHDNARSPREVINLINALHLLPHPIRGLNPFTGTVAQPIVYTSPQSLAASTVQAVQACLAQGFQLEDVALLSLRGRGSSQILQADTLGPWRLRKATGRYDEQGEEIWTDGDLLCETVHRFKGQSARAVILTEVDWPAPPPTANTKAQSLTQSHTQDDANYWRRLYVGLTRAQAYVGWVVGQAGQSALMARLQG